MIRVFPRACGAALVGLLWWGSLLHGSASPVSEPAATTIPNVVVVVTDDQRWDTLWAMPKLRDRVASKGVSFSDAFVTNPWCCPSRASILTGNYSHTTKVWRNHPPNGGFESFDDDSTLATWLDDAGYRTALIGKYFNGYTSPYETYVPPGWDRWVALTSQEGRGDYYNYSLNVDGQQRTYGVRPSEYSTDLLARRADTFIRQSPTDEPLFLFFTPIAPHGPTTPAPRHADAFPGSSLPPWDPPGYGEPDVSDKPSYVRDLPRLSLGSGVQETRRRQYRTLLAVDDAIGRVTDALADTGRLSNTMIVFTSDNGYSWGEHRWRGKSVPYEESVRVPLVIRFDPLTQNALTDDHLVANIDLAPTIARLTRLQPATTFEGKSLVPLLSNPEARWRNGFLIDHLQDLATTPPDPVPTYCALRTERYKYVVYETGEEELYDLARDPYELVSRADEPSRADTITSLRARLRELCDPAPPGLVLP